MMTMTGSHLSVRSSLWSILLLLSITEISSFVSVPSKVLLKPHKTRSSSALMYLSNDDETSSSALGRTRVAGVSVHSSGFHVILQVDKDRYMPLQITDDPLDQRAATSPEALTILQLLAGVDLAGAILPPEMLAQMTILHCEQQTAADKSVEQEIVQSVKLPESSSAQTYSELHPWFRSRVRLPQCTLDGVAWNEDNKFSYSVSVKNFGKVSFPPPSEQVLEQVCYQYHPNVSRTFVAVALALRYKAPIALKETSNIPTLTEEELLQRFPLYSSADNIQQRSLRVAQNIERVFEIHQLQAALRLSLEKEDFAAAERIREQLDSLDSMDDLPIQAETDTSSMQ